ncbi:alpha/beta hydrolase, partial [Paraburkholderia sp. Ac-20336]|nr:alpha/beta hydrolase [Paraburkholderia sp. Ac-20336]
MPTPPSHTVRASAGNLAGNPSSDAPPRASVTTADGVQLPLYRWQPAGP